MTSQYKNLNDAASANVCTGSAFASVNGGFVTLVGQLSPLNTMEKDHANRPREEAASMSKHCSGV